MPFTKFSTCSACKTSSSTLKNCVCGQVVYCSKTCQQVDWARHKPCCPMVILKDIEGKGKGLVATRTLPAGTVIFTEDPLLIYSKKNQKSDWFSSMFQVPSYAEYEEMNLMKRSELMQLYDPRDLNTKYDFHPDPEYARFCRIVTANDISINNKANPSDADPRLDCVYLQFSRINHSCYPNSFCESEAGSVSNSVRTGRIVKKGQEITINYQGSNDGTKEDRREDLLNTWFFKCCCEVCSLTGKESEENDRVRMLVLEHLINVGKKEDLLDMMKDKKNLSRTLTKYLRVLAESFTIEQDRGKLAILLSCCHVFYQQLKRMDCNWLSRVDQSCNWNLLQMKLGNRFPEKMDSLAISYAAVLNRYIKEKVDRNLGLLSQVANNNSYE